MENEVFRYLKCIFVTVFIILATIGNGSVIYAVRKYKKLNTVPNMFVLNLAIADILFALTGMPFIFITTISGRWVLGDTMCVIGGLLNTLTCTASIWTLVMISVHRYFAVAKANTLKTIYTRKRTYVIMGGVWVFSFCISMPPLLGWGRFKEGAAFCLIDGSSSLMYSIFLSFIDYFAPFIFLSCLYFVIFCLLKKHEKLMVNKKSNLATGETSENESSTNAETPTTPISPPFVLSPFPPPGIAGIMAINQTNTSISKPVTIGEAMTATTMENYRTEEHYVYNNNTFHRSISTQSLQSTFKLNSFSPSNRINISNKKRKQSSSKRRKLFFIEVKVTKMLLIVICGFFICWTPFLIGSIQYAFGASPTNFESVTFGIMIACLNSVINPIIYAVMNNNFRFAFKSMYINIKLTVHRLFKGRTKGLSP